MQQRETTTDRLADIIDVIRVGRRTGTLTVERGENLTFEEGMIVFAYGQVTRSVVGSRIGPEALRWLSTWGTCRFRFTFSDTNSVPYPDSGSSPSSRQTARLPEYEKNGSSSNGESQRAPIPMPGIPYRTKHIDSVLPHMEPMGLSRIHKRLFLLIDGQRTIPEIARLMGKSAEEIQEHLNDLINADFIRL